MMSKEHEIFTYIRNGDIEYVTAYLMSGGDPNIRAEPDRTRCIIDGKVVNMEVIGFLFGLMIDTDTPPPDTVKLIRNTPLSFAIKWGYTEQIREIIKLLLEYGADPNIKYAELKSPLCNAILYRNLELAKMLLEHGADANDADSPLYIAAAEIRDLELTRLLLNHGANVNFRTKAGGVPMIFHVRCYRIIKLLIDYGVDLDVEDDNGNKWISYVLDKRNAELFITYSKRSFELNYSRDMLYYSVKNSGTVIKHLLSNYYMLLL